MTQNTVYNWTSIDDVANGDDDDLVADDEDAEEVIPAVTLRTLCLVA